MKQVRVLGVAVDATHHTQTIQEIEDIVNKELIRLEKNGSRIMNIIPCGSRFLILHEEQFDTMLK